MANLSPSSTRTLPSALSLFSVSLIASAALSGCGMGTASTAVTGQIVLSGTVHGGQQPVNKSSILLYTAGSSGNGSMARSMLNNPIQTNNEGYFNITSDYHCNNSTDQVYIVSVGGDSGSGTSNNSLVMMDALGACGNLLTSGYHITINEITTAAAAYALAPFMTSYTNVGASATNATGLANAFLDAHLLADPEAGKLATLASNQTIQSAKMLAMADVIAPCVNSDGTTACQPLFSAATVPGASAPSNTLNALLNIVRNPSNNVTPVFKCINGQAPFPTTLTSAPTDWTMSLTSTAASLYSPSAIAIDSAGDVWAVGQNSASGTSIPNGIMYAFTPQGIPFNTAGYGNGVLEDSYGIAIDVVNHIWVPNWDNVYHNGTTGSLTVFYGNTGGNAGTVILSQLYDNSLDYPQGIAADSNANIFIGDYGDSAATIYKDTASLVAGNVATGQTAFPIFVAADGSGGFWMANSGDSTVTYVNSAGTVINPSCCAQTYGIAVDATSNAWTANYGSNSVSELTPAGDVVIGQLSVAGVNDPSAVAVDAAGTIWVSNFHAGTKYGTISEIAGNGGTLDANGTALAAGTPVSPAYVSLTTPGGYGLDAKLIIPNAIRPDASGNLWIADEGGNAVVMFFGLATPTSTPTLGLPTAP